MKLVFCLIVALAASAAAFHQHNAARARTSLKLFDAAKGPDALEPVDPDNMSNYEAHLGNMLKAGRAERPDPELGSKLRARFADVATTKRKAASSLKSSNAELSQELEDLADELEETSERFSKMAQDWDSRGRPSPELPNMLRDKAYPSIDPNYEEHLPDMLKAGSQERPSYDLPSELRMLKYKQSASVKKMAATELKKMPENAALAAEMEEMAAEIEESHERFEKIAAEGRRQRMAYEDTSKSTR